MIFNLSGFLISITFKKGLPFGRQIWGSCLGIISPLNQLTGSDIIWHFHFKCFNSFSTITTFFCSKLCTNCTQWLCLCELIVFHSQQKSGIMRRFFYFCWAGHLLILKPIYFINPVVSIFVNITYWLEIIRPCLEGAFFVSPFHGLVVFLVKAYMGNIMRPMKVCM